MDLPESLQSPPSSELSPARLEIWLSNNRQLYCHSTSTQMDIPVRFPFCLSRCRSAYSFHWQHVRHFRGASSWWCRTPACSAFHPRCIALLPSTRHSETSV